MKKQLISFLMLVGLLLISSMWEYERKRSNRYSEGQAC